MITLLLCTANKQQASSQRLYYIFWYVSYVYCSEVSGVLYVRLAKGAITVYSVLYTVYALTAKCLSSRV